MDLPKKDGHQVLGSELRSYQRFQAIPVLVLTASAVHRAVLQAAESAFRRLHDQAGQFGSVHAGGQVVALSPFTELVLPPDSPLQGTVATR